MVRQYKPTYRIPIIMIHTCGLVSMLFRSKIRQKLTVDRAGLTRPVPSCHATAPRWANLNVPDDLYGGASATGPHQQRNGTGNISKTPFSATASAIAKAGHSGARLPPILCAASTRPTSVPVRFRNHEAIIFAIGGKLVPLQYRALRLYST